MGAVIARRPEAGKTIQERRLLRSLCSLAVTAALSVFFSASALAFQLESPSFKEGEKIPSIHTCDGKNLSPALKWKGAPQKTRGFVLIMEDPDAPGGIWTHWVLYVLPPNLNNIPQAFPPISTLANGEMHGFNDFKDLGYGGPCPPSGTHRYFFKLFALDTFLKLSPGMTKEEVLKAIEGHILAETHLMGTYQRLNA